MRVVLLVTALFGVGLMVAGFKLWLWGKDSQGSQEEAYQIAPTVAKVGALLLGVGLLGLFAVWLLGE